MVAGWYEAIKEIDSTLDFRISARGWCYILEEKGGLKGDFGAAQWLIIQCRKNGLLPINICSEDDRRVADGLESIDGDVENEALSVIAGVSEAHEFYNPISFWENQPNYIEMVVEKIDLKSLFAKECAIYNIPITNNVGWADINSRAAMTKRFRKWEDEGKQCVLLYCGDHDPKGLVISKYMRSNLDELSCAEGVEWTTENLIIERFGLNADFIEEQGLTWIDNLETGSGESLADPERDEHWKEYVQSYIKQFGERKCEANAIVTRPKAGRALCREAIERHIDQSAVAEWEQSVEDAREDLRKEIRSKIDGGSLDEERA